MLFSDDAGALDSIKLGSYATIGQTTTNTWVLDITDRELGGYLASDHTAGGHNAWTLPNDFQQPCSPQQPLPAASAGYAAVGDYTTEPTPYVVDDGLNEIFGSDIVYDPMLVEPLNNRRWPSMRIGGPNGGDGGGLPVIGTVTANLGSASSGTVVGALASAVPVIPAEADARDIQLPPTPPLPPGVGPGGTLTIIGHVANHPGPSNNDLLILTLLGLALEPEVALPAEMGAEAFGGGFTTLYRAVGPAELEDIEATGAFRNLGSAEGKYFMTSGEAASSYAKQAVSAFGDPPYSLVQTTVPDSIFDGLLPATVIVL